MLNFFLKQIMPDWGNTTQADTAGLGSIGITFNLDGANYYLLLPNFHFYILNLYWSRYKNWQLCLDNQISPCIL